MDSNTLPTPDLNMSKTPKAPDSANLDGAVPAMPIPSAPKAQPANQTSSSPAPVAPAPNLATDADDSLPAADADLIEKEWVQKAKAIVDRTRQDPYLQNKEITKAKADYLKKRYNKIIKVTEE